MSIVVLGTIALDSVKTPQGAREHILGGSAAHFSMAARFFTNVNLVAIIGEDFPKKHINFLHQKGVILTSLIKSKGKTFRWQGEYKGDLNTALTLDTELGVLSIFRPTLTSEQKKIQHIFLANVDPDIQANLLDKMHSARLVGLDSMNYWIHSKKASLLELLKRVDIYVANEQEAKDLSGENNLIKAAKKLHSFGPKMIVVKKGEHGVLFFSKKLLFILPAYPVEKIVDPTGAGDTFAGGFMGYLAKVKRINQENIKKALLYGTILASFNVEGFGLARTAHVTLADIEKRAKIFRKFIDTGEYASI
ncbi:MAG: PfkB family carbohydrate kinase [Candidatus Omnitrophota bacterium]